MVDVLEAAGSDRLGAWGMLGISSGKSSKEHLIQQPPKDKKGLNPSYMWLVVWNIFLFFHIFGIRIPTDELIFFREVDSLYLSLITKRA